MAVQQVFSGDDLRKKILSYVVYDVYKCSLCGGKCSPLDSILYKQKTHKIIHFDEDGNEYVEKYWEYGTQTTIIHPDIILCNEFITEYDYDYKYSWTHKNCCNHYAMCGIKIFPMYILLKDYINNNGTPYHNIKNNGHPDSRGQYLKTLLYDGNFLFQEFKFISDVDKEEKKRRKNIKPKADYFENLMYNIAVTEIKRKNSIAKNRFEIANGEINERRERIKKTRLKEMLQIIRPEIFTNMLIKKYQQKEINFRTFHRNMMDINNYRHNENLQIIFPLS
jgi:hypothetical protein